MAIIDYDPWKGDPGNAIAPHRPSLDQIGGGNYEDDQNNLPPDPTTMPSAAMENANQRTLAGLAATGAVAKFTLRFVAGAPTIDRATFANDDLTPAILSPTDNADGDTVVSWPADTFPLAAAGPEISINEDNGCARASVIEISNGVRIITKDNAGTGLDTACTITIN